MKNLFDRFARSRRARRLVGWVGVALVIPFAVWVPLSALQVVPSMVEVFGVPGLRFPASVVISGLLIAAIGFWDYDNY
ncbi:hypothetical protein [Microbulbifer guangxiensis]|uniref:hypothetical protein n=1 Tax=Microbulbifer guangxiensis TaxID=2904249 RepID=UPI001F42BEBE|nr:hypothetical protein [Microbulbifer guangxiensis]